MALLQHWIHPVGDMGERLSYGLTLVLAMMALKISVTELIPKLPNQTYLDRYVLSSFTFIVILVGASIIPHRFCKPSCEYVECRAEVSDEYGSSFFKSWVQVNEGTGLDWNITLDGEKNCDCDCAADNLLLLIGAAIWILLNISFIWQYAGFDKHLTQTMRKHNLEY